MVGFLYFFRFFFNEFVFVMLVFLLDLLLFSFEGASASVE